MDLRHLSGPECVPKGEEVQSEEAEEVCPARSHLYHKLHMRIPASSNALDMWLWA